MQDDNTTGGGRPAPLTRVVVAGTAMGSSDAPGSEQEEVRWAAWQALLLGQVLDRLAEKGEGAQLLRAALRRLYDSIPADLRDVEPAHLGDPQHGQRRRLAAEVRHLEGMVNRRATMDEMHRVARRCVAICEGDAVGVLAEVQRWGAA